MPQLRNSVAPQTRTRTVAKIMGRMQLADFLKLPEDNFRKFVKETEEDPLFKKLTYPGSSSEKIISFRRFPSSDSVSNFSEFHEEKISDNSSPGIGKLLEQNKELLPLIRSMGMDNFKKHFIFNENHLGMDEIASECGLAADVAREIMSLVNNVFLVEEYFFNPPINPDIVARHWRVADIDKDGKEFLIRCHSLSMARGRYSIDYKKLLALREVGRITEKELAKLNRLISKLELINARKTLLYRTIKLLIEKQVHFLKSGDDDDFVPFTQKSAAKILGITPGVLSRAISRKSIGLIQGDERAFKDFFPSKKTRNKEIVRKILSGSSREDTVPEQFTDKYIKDELKEKYGVLLSRRSVCQYRKELTRN